jgi:hypothetical protein
LKLFAHSYFVSLEGMHDWGQAIGVIKVLALEEFIPRKTEDGEVGWEDRHG